MSRASPVRIRLVALAYALLAVPLMLGAAWVIHADADRDALQAEAAQEIRDISGRVAALETLMAALVGLRHAHAEDDGGALIALAARLREQVPFVTSLGRYRRVRPDERTDFADDMRERGLHEFRVASIDDEGRVGTAAADATLYPISMLEPMMPSNVGLLGADLGAIDGLAARLERSAGTDLSMLAELPAGWPGRGRLVLFHPGYLGTHAPTDTAERREQSDGGFWITVDPGALLGESAPGFDVTASIGPADRGDGSTELYRRPAADLSPRVLEELYRPRALHERWRIGADVLEVMLTPRPGIRPRALVATAIVVLLTTCAFGSVLASVRLRRRHRTEQAAHREALYRARATSARTLEAISDAVVGIDVDAVVLHLNPAAERLLGAAAPDAPGRRLGAVLPLVGKHGEPFDPHRAMARLRSSPDVELDVRPAHGDPDTVFRATLTRAAHGVEPLGRETSDPATDAVGDAGAEHILVLRDISDERRLTRELEWQANHDSLTGCTNRHYFEKRLASLLADRAVSGRDHALLYLDLDQFKVVNDTCGHATGDRLLIELTARLRAVIRKGDVLSRLGGDEFGLIVVDAAPADALEVADGIYAAFQSMEFTHERRVFSVRASIGMVDFVQAGDSMADLMAAADIACYAAKENGRNELVVYRADDATLAMRSTELNWLPRLQQALDEDRFRLHAQPIADIGPNCRSGRIRHFEFLLRLADDDGREITPWQIIQAAERYGLMRRLDRWVIVRALETVARHAPGLPPGTGFSINLSGQSAADPTLIDFIVAAYERFGIEPSMIGFELTETAAISHFDTAVELVRGIRALGSHVSLDDFGSGLSSFGYLKNLPIDVLKIDGQFVREIADNPVDRSMVRAMSEIARAMDIRTVAEFVEDQRSVDVLVEIGIDRAQGYHIGKPMPVGDALALLDRDGHDAALSRAA